MEYDLPQLTLRQLEYLISVGEAGSIARDFEALNVSSSSKSAAISQLEEELGFSLFVSFVGFVEGLKYFSQS